MVIIKCRLCKKPFQSAGPQFCTDCLRQIEQDFFTVRDYIYDHKKSDADTVSKETGVSRIVIDHLVKEGRLYYEETADGGPGPTGYKCKICGKPCDSDKICRDCKAKIGASMQSQLGKKEVKGTTNQKTAAKGKAIGMHTGSLGKKK